MYNTSLTWRNDANATHMLRVSKIPTNLPTYHLNPTHSSTAAPTYNPMDNVDTLARDRAPRRRGRHRGKRVARSHGASKQAELLLSEEREEDLQKLKRVADKLSRQEHEREREELARQQGKARAVEEFAPEPRVSMVEESLDNTDVLCPSPHIGDEDLWKNLFSEDNIKLYSAVKALRGFLSRRGNDMRSPAAFILTNFPRVYQRLVGLLSCDHTALQYQALCCIYSICQSGSGNRSALVRDEVIGSLVVLLSSGESFDVRLVVVAAKCLGIIAADNSIFRATVVEAGGIPALVSLITPSAPSKLQRASGTALYQVSASDNAITTETRTSILSALNVLIYHVHERTLIEACLTLCSVCSTAEMTQRVVSTGFLPRVIELLRHNSVNVQKAALIACDSILTSRYLRARALVKVEVLPALSGLLEHESPSIRKRCCALLSNLICKSEFHIQAILFDPEHKLLERLMFLALKDQLTVSLWSSSALANAVVKCTEQQLAFFKTTEISNTLGQYLQKKDFILNGDIVKQAITKLKN